MRVFASLKRHSLCGKPPFYARTDEQMNELVIRGKWRVPPDVKLSDAGTCPSTLSGLAIDAPSTTDHV
jgi:hypothetical protein